MPDDAKPSAKKKNLRTAGIVGVVALVAGIGYFWLKNRQSGGSSSTPAGTDTTGGVTGSGFTDMGDIIQTVQGPPGKTGATGKTGPRGPSGDDDDTKPKRQRCPRGFHFEAVPSNSDLWPAGGKRVKGGFCVPNRK